MAFPAEIHGGKLVESSQQEESKVQYPPQNALQEVKDKIQKLSFQLEELQNKKKQLAEEVTKNEETLAFKNQQILHGFVIEALSGLAESNQKMKKDLTDLVLKIHQKAQELSIAQQQM